ncbi:hypothetical protein [Paractinoplanes maris]|uniref:hypothetical protein n=1 Tax=Paractinoplanes maris TaxID=1734446 RepID=UPI0020207AFE|nr:hypothetical protein [Actinoplanes maris]
MKRWVAALWCGLLLASGMAGPAHAADPAPAASADCVPLKEGRLGILADDEKATGRAVTGARTCHAVHLSAGTHFIQIATPSVGGFTGWVTSVADGRRVCLKPAGTFWSCSIATAGDYTIDVDTYASTPPFDYRVAAVLVDPIGCTPVTGTRWDSPTTKVPHSDPLESHCATFPGEPGGKVYAYTDDGLSRISDAAGQAICWFPNKYQNPPCVLTGDGPYTAVFTTRSVPADEPAGIQVASVAPFEGCPVVTPARRFGVAPADPASGIRCRELHVPAAGTYALRARAVANEPRDYWVVDADVNVLRDCGELQLLCTFPAAGTYYLFAGQRWSGLDERPYRTTFTPASAAGCRSMDDQGAHGPARRGSFATIGEIDCYTVETDAEYLSILTARTQRPDVALLTSSGEPRCGRPGYCIGEETGGPYRVLASPKIGQAAGDYVIGLQRQDRFEGCRPWRPDVTVSFGPHRFTECFTFTNQAEGDMAVAIERTSGSGAATGEVNTDAGRVCEVMDEASFTCMAFPGAPTTLTVTADPEVSTYRVTRSYVTPPAG